MQTWETLCVAGHCPPGMDGSWQHSGWAPSLELLAQAASGCALGDKWAAARHTQDGSRLRGMADPQVLVLGEGSHQRPVPGVGPAGRAVHHMPGVARRRGTRKVARSEAWKWGGYVEGSTGQAEGLASEVGAKKPTLGSQDPAGCAERDRDPLQSLPCRLPGALESSPLCWVGSWVPGLPTPFKAAPLLLAGAQKRHSGP